VPQALLFSTVVLTSSLAGYVVGTRLLGLPGISARLIAGKVLESIGMGILFFLVNLALGLGLVIAVRTATAWFLALYVFKDVVLLPIALIQGLAFWWWRELGVRAAAGSAIRVEPARAVAPHLDHPRRG